LKIHKDIGAPRDAEGREGSAGNARGPAWARWVTRCGDFGNAPSSSVPRGTFVGGLPRSPPASWGRPSVASLKDAGGKDMKGCMGPREGTRGSENAVELRSLDFLKRWTGSGESNQLHRLQGGSGKAGRPRDESSGTEGREEELRTPR
jgi:hypothetical protein